MLTFLQFITETPEKPDHLIWYVGKKGLKSETTKDGGYIHASMMMKHKELPWKAPYKAITKSIGETPRGRVVIDHRKQVIHHTDYGWGSHPDVDAQLKNKYPTYRHESK